MAETEQVLVVKTSLLSSILAGGRGLIKGKDRQFREIVESSCEFLPRPQAEIDPSYKQIIPYVLLIRGGEVFTMRRLSKGGETRLHGLISLGVGGHINPPDKQVEGANALMAGLLREIDEEVEIDDPGTLTPIGLINDDTTEVGSVHLGLVYTMDVLRDARVREMEKLEGAWMPLSQAQKITDRMESWSAIALEALTG